MAKQTYEIDRVFHALGDTTRLSVVEILTRGPMSVSDLAKSFEMALPSFTQHLGVLEASGLVKSNKAGRVRTYYLDAKCLKAAERWIDEQRRVAKKKQGRVDAYLLTIKRSEPVA
jgi:DNA-binding transcriptional ArsR family regulator